MLRKRRQLAAQLGPTRAVWGRSACDAVTGDVWHSGDSHQQSPQRQAAPEARPRVPAGQRGTRVLGEQQQGRGENPEPQQPPVGPQPPACPRPLRCHPHSRTGSPQHGGPGRKGGETQKNFIGVMIHCYAVKSDFPDGVRRGRQLQQRAQRGERWKRGGRGQVLHPRGRGRAGSPWACREGVPWPPHSQLPLVTSCQFSILSCGGKGGQRARPQMKANPPQGSSGAERRRRDRALAQKPAPEVTARPRSCTLSTRTAHGAYPCLPPCSHCPARPSLCSVPGAG